MDENWWGQRQSQTPKVEDRLEDADRIKFNENQQFIRSEYKDL